MRHYRQWVMKYKKQYSEFLANSCLDEKGRRDPMRVYNRALFALLSVNTSFDITEKAYADMKGKYWTGQRRIMHRYMRHGIHYAYARGGYLHDFTKAYKKNAAVFLKQCDESWNEYRRRLVREVKGLGFIKISFFITLVYPAADLCCIDRWILRCLGLHANNMPRLSNQIFYQSLENIMRQESKILGVDMFQYQWAIWDCIRFDTGNDKGLNPMASLNNS